MKDALTYKEFIGLIHLSSKDDIFYGKIEGINDLVTFEGKSVLELKNNFKEAVEEYLKLCEKVKKEPIKSLKGSFNVRITPELHPKAYKLSLQDGISLNQFVQKSIVNDVNRHLKK